MQCSIRGAYRYVAGAQACLNNDFRGQTNLISQEDSAIVTLRLFKKPIPTAGKKTSDVFHEKNLAGKLKNIRWYILWQK